MFEVQEIGSKIICRRNELRAKLRVICTHSADSRGVSNNAGQTHNTTTEHGHAQMSFRNLGLTLTTNRPS